MRHTIASRIASRIAARRIGSRALVVGLAALVVSTTTACRKGGGGDEDEAGGAPTAMPTVAVGTTTATEASFRPMIRAIGVVSPTPGGYAELSAPAPARISRVYVTVGQPVRAGQELVALDAAPFAAAASGASAAREAAQRAYDRQVELSKEGIVARKAVDQAAADLAQANAAAVAAQHTYTLSMLRAPISGVVTRLAAVTGAAADPSQVLVAVANPAALAIVLQVSADDAGNVHPGEAVTLYEKDNPTAPSIGRGAVVTVGAAIDTVTHAVPVTVRPGKTTRPLRLQETVTGEIATTGAASGVSVPMAALIPDSAGSYHVFVVKGGVARATPVETGARSDSTVQITKGVGAGDVVVTTGAYGIEDSAKVAVPKH